MLYFGLGNDQLREHSVALLEGVRLGEDFLERLPSQLSGGEKQRIAVARAFAANPDLVLCDEVTSALDVSVEAAVLDLLKQLQADRGTTYIFVSHDLAVVRAIADRVAVLYQGRICEMGPSENVYRFPSQPYTEVLLGAVPEPDLDAGLGLVAKDVPDLFPRKKGVPSNDVAPGISAISVTMRRHHGSLRSWVMRSAAIFHWPSCIAGRSSRRTPLLRSQRLANELAIR